MKKTTICFMTLFTIVFSGCGSDELTRSKAEKIIRSDEPWTKSYTFEVKEGAMLTRFDFSKIHNYLVENKLITVKKKYEKNKRVSTGEKYLRDIYQVNVTDKFKSMKPEQGLTECSYGIYPAGKRMWHREKYQCALYKINMKLIDYKFLQINSIRDLRKNGSSYTDCGAIVNFSYEKLVTPVGKSIGEEGEVIEKDICFQLFDDGWKERK